MTEIQKQKARQMRLDGNGYRRIATELELSLNTVKSFCRRNRLTGVGRVVALNADVSVQKGLICKCCGKRLKHIYGKKRRIYCSDSCRKKYWKNKHKETEK